MERSAVLWSTNSSKLSNSLSWEAIRTLVFFLFFFFLIRTKLNKSSHEQTLMCKIRCYSWTLLSSVCELSHWIFSYSDQGAATRPPLPSLFWGCQAQPRKLHVCRELKHLYYSCSSVKKCLALTAFGRYIWISVSCTADLWKGCKWQDRRQHTGDNHFLLAEDKKILCTHYLSSLTWFFSVLSLS